MVTNPLDQTTSYQYDPSHNLTTVINANSVTAASYTYDAFDRIATYTDSEGWTVTYSYDNADRLTKIAYPDGTADTYTYDNLDLASYQDRQGRAWTYTHDANRRLTQIIDPLGNQKLFGYNEAGQLTSLTDPKGNTTNWIYDVQGRLTAKTYADGSTVSYVYENTTSRLALTSDALGQTKLYSYANDNRPVGIGYLNAANSTPSVSLAYDPYFPRLTSMTDGTGTTQYSYVSVGSPGALRPQQESGPLSNGTIAYAYDALGRLTSRTVAGSGAETFQYDAIGRLTGHMNDVGAFTLSYLGQTGQISERQLASSTLATTWSYLTNAGDRRLAGISNVGLSSSQYSTYTYTTTPEDFITGITETSDSSTVYPNPTQQLTSYNNLNQLSNQTGQPLRYDPNGNLLSDGQRDYAWDAENRLVGITYPGQPGKATAFSYDGLGRRTAISSTPAGGGSAVTTSYIWCGLRICQARNASDAPTREYYAEGEFVPGAPGQPYYYGPDQIGSVRRVFVSASSASAYSYDPYGSPLQSTAPLTDFGYAGMFYNADSGLYLTQYRAFDPTAGRWLSRDPSGEGSDQVANLYAYVGGNPVNLADPLGLCGGPLNNPLGGIASNPALIGFILATEIAGAENPVVAEMLALDLAAEAEAEAAFAASEEAALAAEGIAGGAQSALAAPALANQLATESAASAFTAEGTLSEEALAGSREIIPSSQIGNPEVPSGFSKFTTQTYQSPSGDFQVHFYMNPATSEPFYGLDYKAIFNSGGVGP